MNQDIYSLPSDLYIEGFPLIIKKGKLSMQDGKYILNISFLNIDKKIINKIEIDIIVFDKEKKFSDRQKFTYQNLELYNNEEVGERIKIRLNDENARYFNILIKKITFDDQSLWKNTQNDTKFRKLKKAPLFENNIDSDFKSRFENATKICAKNLPTSQMDIWQCFCGAVNKNSTTKCSVCENDINTLISAFKRESSK